MSQYDALLRHYSARRRAGGGWFMADRYELLWDGKNAEDLIRQGGGRRASEVLPVGSSEAWTKRGALRKARALARVVTEQQQTFPASRSEAAQIPMIDMRA